MGGMKELVTVEQAERVIAVVAVALPAAGIVIGALAGLVRRRVGAGVVIGLLIGLIGPAAWALWRMYNGIMGRYGLDSVKGLLINLALFVAIGLAIGIAVGTYFRRHRVATSQETPSTGGG